MSKSTGNFLTLEQAVEKFSADGNYWLSILIPDELMASISVTALPFLLLCSLSLLTFNPWVFYDVIDFCGVNS